MQIASRARLGCGPNEKILCGIKMHEDLAARLGPIVCRIAQKISSARAREAVEAYLVGGPWALRPFIKEVPNRLTFEMRIRRQNAARRLKAKKKRIAAKAYRRLKRIEALLHAKMDRRALRLEAAEARVQARRDEAALARERRFSRRRESMSPTEIAAADRRAARDKAWRRLSIAEKEAWLEASENKKRERQQRVAMETARKAEASENKKREATLALYAEDVPLPQLALFAGVSTKTVLAWIDQARKENS